MAITPFETGVGLQIPESTDGTSVTLDPIPPGKLAVIRFVSADFVVNSGERPAILSLSTNAGRHNFIPEFTGTNFSQDAFIVSQACFICLKSGETHTVGAKRWPIGAGAVGFVMLSGELVDV